MTDGWAGSAQYIGQRRPSTTAESDQLRPDDIADPFGCVDGIIVLPDANNGPSMLIEE